MRGLCGCTRCLQLCHRDRLRRGSRFRGLKILSERVWRLLCRASLVTSIWYDAHHCPSCRAVLTIVAMHQRCSLRTLIKLRRNGGTTSYGLRTAPCGLGKHEVAWLQCRSGVCYCLVRSLHFNSYADCVLGISGHQPGCQAVQCSAVCLATSAFLISTVGVPSHGLQRHVE